MRHTFCDTWVPSVINCHSQSGLYFWYTIDLIVCLSFVCLSVCLSVSVCLSSQMQWAFYCFRSVCLFVCLSVCPSSRSPWTFSLFSSMYRVVFYCFFYKSYMKQVFTSLKRIPFFLIPPSLFSLPSLCSTTTFLPSYIFLYPNLFHTNFLPPHSFNPFFLPPFFFPFTIICLFVCSSFEM